MMVLVNFNKAAFMAAFILMGFCAQQAASAEEAYLFCANKKKISAWTGDYAFDRWDWSHTASDKVLPKTDNFYMPDGHPIGTKVKSWLFCRGDGCLKLNGRQEPSLVTHLQKPVGIPFFINDLKRDGKMRDEKEAIEICDQIHSFCPAELNFPGVGWAAYSLALNIAVKYEKNGKQDNILLCPFWEPFLDPKAPNPGCGIIYDQPATKIGDSSIDRRVGHKLDSMCW